MKIVYEGKKSTAQSKRKADIYEKYVARERNRERDFMNKLAKELANLFPNTIHVFEDLEKEDGEQEKKVEK